MGTKKEGVPEAVAFTRISIDMSAIYSHRGGTPVPPLWDSSATTVRLECHHGGTESTLFRENPRAALWHALFVA